MTAAFSGRDAGRKTGSPLFLASLLPRRRGIRRYGLAVVGAAEFEDLAQEARRHHGDRIDAQGRVAGRTDDLVGHTEHAFVLPAAKEEAEHRQACEEIVQYIRRNE